MPINYVSKENLQEFATKLNEKQKTIFAPYAAIGAPLTAETAAGMTDETKVYVYTGEEVGYTYGNWYYHDGTGWVSGGVYNATVYETDTTLSESGKPADAKAAGDEINGIKDAMRSQYSEKTVEGSTVTVNKSDVMLDPFTASVEMPYASAGYTAIGLRQRGDNLYVQHMTKHNIDPGNGNFKDATAYQVIGPIDVRNASYLYLNLKHNTEYYTMTVASYTEAGQYVSTIYSASYHTTDISRYWDVSSADYVYLSCRTNDSYVWVGTSRVNKIVNFTDNGDALTVYGGTYNFSTGELISKYAQDGTELAEPVTYMQEPYQIDLFDGNNTMFGIKATTDYTYTGSISATYLVSSIPDIRDDIDDIEQDITGINGDIDVIEGSVSGINTSVAALKADIVPIPSYYEEQVAANILTVRGNMVSVGANGFTFFFITDSHWNLNSKNSPALIQRIGKTLSIDTIIHGGDVIRDSASSSNNSDAVSTIRALKRTGKVFVALGNHDFYYKESGSDEILTYTADQIFGLLQQQESYLMREYEDGYYYADIPGYKTRLIFLNTGAVNGTSADIDQYQTEFLAESLSSTPADWHIIVCQHIWKVSGTITTFATTVSGILDNYNADPESPAFVEAVFVGHNHSDSNWTTEGGIPVVETTCDRRTDSETQTGTVNEQAFDTVTIDYANKVIHMVRTGRGSSRTINYGGEAES